MIKATILIVDDRPENLLTLECLLEAPDIEIVRANSGNEALARTLDHDFALILLDVQMPEMDGYETAELLRSNAKTRSIPIIFLSAAQKERQHVFKGYDSGGVDYILKPFEPVVLKSKMRIFLDMYRQRHQLEQKTRELDAKLVELEEVQQQLEEKNEQLRRLSIRDGLTGLINRRRFDELMKTEWKRGLRNQHPLSVVIVDIDHFKAYNDHYGHLVGDDCLCRVAETLSVSLHREVDRVCRYGGEEFIAILPDTSMEGAVQVAERMRRNVCELRIRHKGSDTADYLTISVGVSCAVPRLDRHVAQLLDSADSALYEAKKSGRNCCRTFSTDTCP